MTGPRPGSLASRLDAPGGAAVLVVEDEPDIAGFLGAYFRASGTQIVHIDPTTPAEVIERAVSVGATCLLVDLNLTGITGFDVLEAVADDERVSALPVVIVSADTRASTQERAAELGAFGYVPKPFNVKDLFATVQAAIDAAGSGPAAAGASGPSLLTAEAVTARLATAVAAAHKADSATTFVLVRVGGLAPSPVLMREAARHLLAALPGAELLGTTAVDELALLFPSTGAADAEALVVAALGDGPTDLALAADRTVNVVLSAGLATSPDHAQTSDELYMAADIALADALDGQQPVVIAR
jgi:DNA-binding response OmpR family regulator